MVGTWGPAKAHLLALICQLYWDSHLVNKKLIKSCFYCHIHVHVYCAVRIKKKVPKIYGPCEA